MLKRIFIFAILFIASTNSFSQKIFATPNATAIGVFNEYPQSSFTGQPSISLPLYNTSYGNYNIQLILNYNTNLLKPYINPSWAGMGWNLSCSGIITRVINDKPDDMSWSNINHYRYSKVDNAGFYYNHNYLSSNNWASLQRLDSAAHDADKYLNKNNNNYYLEDNIMERIA